MAEYIKREAVLRAVQGQRSPCRSPAQNRMLDCLKAAVIRISAADAAPVEGDGYKLVENAELGRIQFLFDGKPDEATRALLKANGFRWSPSQGAWQRMLNDNGRYAAQKVLDELDAIPQF